MSADHKGVGSDRHRGSDLYGRITQQIIEMLGKGVVPWRSPILARGKAGYPKNMNTGKPYRGVNVFLLAVTAHFMGYDSAYWLTFRQAQQRGGHVRKGERATMVVFYKPIEVTDKGTGEVKKVPMLRHYLVFNANQCNGIDVPDAMPYTPSAVKPLEAAKQIVDGYREAPRIDHAGTRAFYVPAEDRVQVPEPQRFTSTEEYFGTLFHELGHSTGHSKRLDRGLDRDLRPFGSPDYSKEELVAEMTAAFLCGEAQIEPVTIANHASYVSGWLGALKGDAKLVVTAASAAQRATEWILGTRPVEDADQSDSEPEPPA